MASRADVSDIVLGGMKLIDEKTLDIIIHNYFYIKYTLDWLTWIYNCIKKHNIFYLPRLTWMSIFITQTFDSHHLTHFILKVSI